MRPTLTLAPRLAFAELATALGLLAACGDPEPASSTDIAPAPVDAASAPDAEPGDGALAPDGIPDTLSGDVDDLEDSADVSPTPDASPQADAAPGTDTAPQPDTAVAPSDASEDAVSDALWRSSLYPEDWEPGHEVDGRGLHDFSWAGYRNGEAQTPAPALAALPTHDVQAFGADPTGASDSTIAVTAAIAAASRDALVDPSAPTGPRAVVRFPAGLYRIDGILEVRTSGVWLIGDGPARSRLHFTRTTGMSFEAHLRLAGRPAHGPNLPLVGDGQRLGVEVLVADASSLEPGDEVTLGWTITPEFVEAHGMTGTWAAFNGQWQPFFRRRVVAVDTQGTPHRVTLDVPLRYPALTRDGASLREDTGLLTECGLEGLGVANAGDPNTAWALDQVHAVALEHAADCVVRDVESFPSPSASAPVLGAHPHLLSGGLIITHSRRVTVSGGRMADAQHRGPGGNGYLYEVRQSGEILFRDLEAHGGRHNFIQNWGFGASGIVWLRVRSSGGRAYPSQQSPLFNVGRSEFHHSLAMANLIDSSWSNDGWAAWNRLKESSGAGHTSTETVFWNASGPGGVTSYQFGLGYIIGTAPETPIGTTRPEGLDPAVFELLDPVSAWYRTEPWDHVEGAGQGATLEPASLYEDQLARRLARSQPPR